MCSMCAPCLANVYDTCICNIYSVKRDVKDKCAYCKKHDNQNKYTESNDLKCISVFILHLHRNKHTYRYSLVAHSLYI